MILSTNSARRMHIFVVAAFLICIAAFCSAQVAAADYPYATGQTATPIFKGSEPIPSDAIVLFDGKDLSQWVMAGSDKPATWTITHGYAMSQDGDIETKQKFNDVQLHVEFWLPLLPENVKGQGRANSGVFFQGFTYEIQVLDSYGLKSGTGDCAAIYSTKPPLVNAARPPKTWQTYDIIFHPAKFDASGAKIASARVTMFWNGVLVHDNDEVPFSTPSHSADVPKVAGPIRLQYHHNSVHFRNVWARPLPE